MCVVNFHVSTGRAGELESAKHRAEATADQLRAEGDRTRCGNENYYTSDLRLCSNFRCLCSNREVISCCVVIFVALIGAAGRAGELESAKHRAEATADQLRAEGEWRSRVRKPPPPLSKHK